MADPTDPNPGTTPPGDHGHPAARARRSVVSPVELAFRTEWPVLIAALTRQFGDLDLAEDVASEAFSEATRRWGAEGVPDRPGAWLLTTARRRALDRVRRDARFRDRLPALHADRDVERVPTRDDLADDQLALIFTCCHPALDDRAAVALVLRSVAGLSTRQIARAFVVPEETMAKRLVRAKAKIRTAGIPFRVPPPDALDARIDAVAGVIYAVFTEGHASSDGESLLRGSLCDEAIFLAETVADLLPEHDEVRSLAALCLLTDARRAARTDADGRPVLLADQDRGHWDRDRIERGLAHLEVAASLEPDAGPFRLQAMIAATHASAPTYADTDWDHIIAVYDAMVAHGGGAVIELNRAVALGERDGPEVGLAALAPIADRPELAGYHYLPSAQAEFLRRAGRIGEARSAYDRAIAECGNEVETAWLEARRAGLDA